MREKGSLAYTEIGSLPWSYSAHEINEEKDV